MDSHKNDPSQSSLMTQLQCVAVSVSAEILPCLYFLNLLYTGCFWASTFGQWCVNPSR